MVLGARPRHLSRFKQEFEKWLESDECWAEAKARGDVDGAVRRIAERAFVQAVTLGSNRSARGRGLEASAVGEYFSGLIALPRDPDRRVERLAQAMAGCGGDGAVLVASSPALARAGQSADAAVWGVSNGPSTASQLRKTGLERVVAGLEEFADSLDQNPCGLWA